MDGSERKSSCEVDGSSLSDLVQGEGAQLSMRVASGERTTDTALSKCCTQKKNRPARGEISDIYVYKIE